MFTLQICEIHDYGNMYPALTCFVKPFESCPVLCLRYNHIQPPKDDLLGRSALNMSSLCFAIGPLPRCKVNRSCQNVPASLLSLAGARWERGLPSNLEIKMPEEEEPRVITLKLERVEAEETWILEREKSSSSILFHSRAPLTVYI